MLKIRSLQSTFDLRWALKGLAPKNKGSMNFEEHFGQTKKYI